MGELLAIPFVSESYDSLLQAQSRHIATHKAGQEHAAVLAVLSDGISSGGLFREGRVRLGLTQAQLAETLGIASPQISLMENDKAAIDPRTDLAMRALLAKKALA